jgi:hypothetical protein
VVYDRQTWVDGDATRPASGPRLQHMEDGIYALSLLVGGGGSGGGGSGGGSGPGGWVDVKAAGAVGDGTVDDATAINAAIAGSAVGSTIWFPPGQYRHGSTIELLSGRRYLGAGGRSGATALIPTSAVTGAAVASHAWNASTVATADVGIVVEGLAILGPGPGVGTAHGLVITGSACRVQDVYVAEVAKAGILFTDLLRSGAVLTNSAMTCDGNRIVDCRVLDTGIDGIRADNAAAFDTNFDGIVSGCAVAGPIAGNAITIQTSDGWLVLGNLMTGCHRNGIDVADAWGTRIIGNRVEDDFGSENLAGSSYAGIHVQAVGGRPTIVADNVVGTSQGGNHSTATRWACYDLFNSGGSAASPAVIICEGNSAFGNTAAATKKAFGFICTRASAREVGSLQIRASGNFVSATGWGGTGTPLSQAFFLDLAILNATATSF